MGSAQWIVAILMASEVIAAFFIDGWPRPPVSFESNVIEVSALALLLHAGGFWR